jgi:hypothetical protein
VTPPRAAADTKIGPPPGPPPSGDAPPGSSPLASLLSDEDDEVGDRTLRGHTFIFPLLQSTAFVTTHFGIRNGFALVIFPDVPVGSLGTFDLKETGIVQNFDLGIKIVDFLGLFAVGSGEVVTGVDVPSLVLSQNSFSASGEAGAIVRLLRLEETGTQVAVRASIGAGTGRALSVVTLVTNILNGNQRSVNDVLKGDVGKYLLVPESTVTYAFALNAAQVITRNFSLQASLELRHGDQTTSPYDPTVNANVDQTVGTTSLTPSLAFTADGAPSGLPVALMIEYSVIDSFYSLPSGPGTSSVGNFLGLGLYYTGRRHLQVGLGGAFQFGLQPMEGADANGHPASSGTPAVYDGQFILRYVW